jgi:hypothetical protein
MDPTGASDRDGRSRLRRYVPDQHASVWALLLGFVAALLLGAFHPLGLAQQQHVDHHVCQGDEQHVDPAHEHDHHHDPASCSFCHLVQEVQGDGQLDGPTFVGPAPLVVRAPLALPAARPDEVCSSAFRSRAPPAA